MLRIERTAGGDGRVFRLIGDLEGGAQRQLQRILAGPASDGGLLTIDLSGLGACDADCARLLVTLTKRARISDGNLVLTSPTAEVLHVLTTIAAPEDLCILDAEESAPAQAAP